MEYLPTFCQFLWVCDVGKYTIVPLSVWDGNGTFTYMDLDLLVFGHVFFYGFDPDGIQPTTIWENISFTFYNWVVAIQTFFYVHPYLGK